MLTTKGSYAKYVFIYVSEIIENCYLFKFIKNMECLGCKRKHKPTGYLKTVFLCFKIHQSLRYCIVYLHLCHSYHMRIVIK